MSRYDPREAPWIRAETVALWKKYREEHTRDWNHRRETIKDGVRAPDGHVVRCSYTPEDLHFDTRGFAQYRTRPELLRWQEEQADTPHGYTYVPTVRWTESPFVVVVRQIPYDMDDWDTYGTFTDDEATAYYGKTWGTMLFVEPMLKKHLLGALKTTFGYREAPPGFDDAWKALREDLRQRVGPDFPKNLHERTLQGPDSRHAWRVGCYDTFQGNNDHRDRYRKRRYIQLADYNYDELRAHFWFQGRSKREADELARQEFRSRIAFMKRIEEGDVYELFIEAKVYREDDEDEVDELASAGSSTVVDLDYVSERRYLDEMARESAAEALAEARKEDP